jgi:hypothetical protein
MLAQIVFSKSSMRLEMAIPQLTLQFEKLGKPEHSKAFG